MLKLIHAADLHLDSPFSGLNAQHAAQRREEQRLLLDRLTDLANEERADLVLLAGDLLDGSRVYRETVEALAQSLSRIRARVFISPGNHDPYGLGSPYLSVRWPDNVHIFSSSSVASVELPELNCVVHGAAFTSFQQDFSPLASFRAPADGRLHLMVLHGNTQGGGYGPISPQDIASCGLDYLALGHIHQQSGLQRSGTTFWAYPGCPEGRGFDELGEKGVLAVEVTSGLVQAQFVPLCSRRYEILDIDLTNVTDPLTAVETALPADTGRDIYRIRLTGEHNLGDGDLTQLSEVLSSRFYGLELRNHTRIPRDMWARCGEDTLTGLFLRSMAAQCASNPDDKTLQLAARFGVAALEHGEDIAP